MRRTLRVVAISDTHGYHEKLKVPDGDLLIHAGDIAGRGEWRELSDFNIWLGALPHRHKVVIAGNHDFWFERFPGKARAMLSNATYLQDEAVEIEGRLLYGSPWQPEFGDWAFNLPRGEQLARVWQKIPESTDILVTHGPPAGILDLTVNGDLCGCADLRQRIAEVRPRLHVFGHIHEAYGRIEQDGTTYVNASSVNFRYKPVNEPVVLELP